MEKSITKQIIIGLLNSFLSAEFLMMIFWLILFIMAFNSNACPEWKVLYLIILCIPLSYFNYLFAKRFFIN